MMDDQEIERNVEMLATASAYSETMIESIMEIARKGYSYHWFLTNWHKVVMNQQGLTLEEVTFIKPWIETWADEAYYRLEKEKDK